MAMEVEKRARTHTLRKLITSAAHVFAHKGVAGASVDDLASAAGFTRGAFYSNFYSKEEIFAATLTDFTEGLVQAMQDAIEQVGDPESPEQAIRAVLSAMRPVGRIWVMLDAEGVRQSLIDEDVRRVYLQAHDYLSRALLASITQGAHQSSGVFSTYSKAALQNLANLLLSAYSQSIILEMLEGPDSTERLVDLLMQLLFAQASDAEETS